jgi:hypothetical protein
MGKKLGQNIDLIMLSNVKHVTKSLTKFLPVHFLEGRVSPKRKQKKVFKNKWRSQQPRLRCIVDDSWVDH